MASTPPYNGSTTPQFGATPEGKTPEFGSSTPPYGSSTPPYGSSTPPYGGSTPPYRASTPPQASVGGAASAASAPYGPYGAYGAYGGLLPAASTYGAPPKLSKKASGNALSRKLLETYFKTFDYPFVRHHIDSYDNLLTQDIPAIIKDNNPILILKELIPNTNTYMYRVEIFIGGLEGTEIEIGTPTVSLQKTKEVRVLFPNEARLRNLNYAATVYADVVVRIVITDAKGDAAEPVLKEYKHMPLFSIPVLLHSRFCILHGKPASFLTEAGECPQDQGGYFIIGGSEKILITSQEQAFNTFYVQEQPRDPKVATYGSITCLSPTSRQVKVVGFYWNRATDSLVVTLPFVRKPIPIFVLFRAMGLTTDRAILKLIYPDLSSSEANQMLPLLTNSIAEAFPFLDTYSAVQFIKAMTKGFSENHVYDILFNQTFIHISDKQGGSRLHFLAECVRKFMRVHTKIDTKTDKDDTRNQRCLTSGFLIRMLFINAYNTWKKAVRRSIDEEFAYNVEIYSGPKFVNVFSEGNTTKLFNLNIITDGLMKGFRGKWVTGGAGGGGSMGHSDEKTGVLQAMSRLSYLDFMSHCRRVTLSIDTSVEILGPRKLHTSQYGFYCTNETPGGHSIGIAKNLSLMTLISLATNPDPIVKCLLERGWIIPCSEMREDLQIIGVPFFINSGLLGYTLNPFELTEVLKLMKWTGCLPALSSIGFSIRNRRVFLFVDEGRPCRPLIHLGKDGEIPTATLESAKTWRELVLGNFGPTAQMGVSTASFTDPFLETPGQIPLTQYKELLSKHAGVIEYIDPYEQNEAFIINFPEHFSKEASHMEVHPCTIVSIVNGMIPFANFNQSPRNQLSCSQSKQGVGMYATNFHNRYDNSVNILCYGEAPLVRTLTYDALGQGKMPYGSNLIMAIMGFNGYNQDDGIIFNEDSFQRGMFRNINYRSYETFEEVDRVASTTSTIANPQSIPNWTDLKPGRDYSKLDERGIIRNGVFVDQNTVLVGKYIQDKSGKIKDASLTAQVWTSGRVESSVVTVNNIGLMLVKVRITQDRIPELGDKFSTRHGQKGTIGMLYRAHDLPRTADGLVPDMLVNPHCIPSRMTVAQLMEMIFGEVCYQNTTVGDATIFMSDPTAVEAIGRVLEGHGMEKTNNTILYDGASGKQIETNIFMGPVYGMRLKHMTEDKWNARAEGRREQKTHQPTGGRGAQGGLRIGEMERDALAGHGISGFLKESMMERADKTSIRICNGCGTVPIYNDKQKLMVCSLCDGPVGYIGTNASNMEILPPLKKSIATTSIVEMPYATKLLADELGTYLNMGMRIVTGKGLIRFNKETPGADVADANIRAALSKPLPERVMPETRVPEFREVVVEEVKPAEEDLYAMGVVGSSKEEGAQAEEEEEEPPLTQNASVEQRLKEFSEANSKVQVAQATARLAEANVQVAQAKQASASASAPAPLQQQQMPPIVQQGGYYPTNSASTQPMGYMNPMGQIGPMGQMAPMGQMTPQTYMVGGGQIMMAGQMPSPTPMAPMPMPIIYNSPIPNGPPTVVIDTRPPTMQGEYMEDQGYANAGMPVMGANRRHTTPRNRQQSPARKGVSFAGGPIATSQRITVSKI